MSSQPLKISAVMIQFHEAVSQIKARLGVSRGKAEAMVRQACASPGVIRSEKEPYSMVGSQPQGEGPPEPIEPSEWCEREIDMMTDKDGCSYWVKVDKADFEFWLNAQSAPKPKKRAYKQEEVREAISTLWPDGKLPAENEVLVDKVIKWFKQEGKLAPERTTILRAAGRRKK